MEYRFKLNGEAVFYAESIDDAFRKLAEHFTALANGDNSNLMAAGTDLQIYKEE